MPRTTPFLYRPAAVLFAGALLLTACGSSGGSDADKAEKTTTTAAKTTTTADKTTTTEATAPDGPTAEELAAILPTAADIGEAFTVDTTNDFSADSAIEKATETECPGAAALLAPPEDTDSTIGFETPAGQTIRITLSSGVEAPADADIQAAIDEINDCDAVVAEENGLKFTASFSADLNDTYGETGVQIQAAVNITDGTDSYDVNKYRVQFIIGTVGVAISGGDGLADDGTVTPIETVGLEAVAAEMEKRVNDL